MSEYTRVLSASIRQNRGFYGALVLLAVLYITYNFIHPRGFTTAVLVQNANEVVAIAFVAMAQTLPVLLGGLDLSVGAVMTLSACIASELVNGSPAQIVLGMVITLLSGAAFGLMNSTPFLGGEVDRQRRAELLRDATLAALLA